MGSLQLLIFPFISAVYVVEPDAVWSFSTSVVTLISMNSGVLSADI